MNTSLLVHDVIAVEIEKPAQGRDTGCWWQTIRLITKSDVTSITAFITDPSMALPVVRTEHKEESDEQKLKAVQ